MTIKLLIITEYSPCAGHLQALSRFDLWDSPKRWTLSSFQCY